MAYPKIEGWVKWGPVCPTVLSVGLMPLLNADNSMDALGIVCIN